MAVFWLSVLALILGPAWGAAAGVAARPHRWRTYIGTTGAVLAMGCFCFGLLLASATGRGNLTLELLRFAVPGLLAALGALIVPLLIWTDGTPSDPPKTEESFRIGARTFASLLALSIVVTGISWGSWTYVSYQRPVEMDD